jgi:hypothetical protein
MAYMITIKEEIELGTTAEEYLFPSGQQQITVGTAGI